MKTMDRIQLTPRQLERMLVMAAPPVRRVPDWPAFPKLTFFMRLLAVYDPPLAEEVAELMSLYAMGWHLGPDDAPPRDCTTDFAARFASTLLDRGRTTRLYNFESRFTLRMLDDPAVRARHARPPLRVCLDSSYM